MVADLVRLPKKHTEKECLKGSDSDRVTTQNGLNIKHFKVAQNITKLAVIPML